LLPQQKEITSAGAILTGKGYSDQHEFFLLGIK